jgi:hypothetical protein
MTEEQAKIHDETLEAERLANRTYAEKRRAEYDPIEDVVDEMAKMLDFIITELNLSNCEEFKTAQAKRKAIKAKYPKPTE